MRNSSFGSKEKSGWNIGGETTVRASNGGAQETDPLIRRGSTTASSTNQSSTRRPSKSPDNSNLRERRPSRSSPLTTSLFNQRFGGPSGEQQNYQSPAMDATSAANTASVNSNSNGDEPISNYTQLNDDGSRTGNASVGGSSQVSYQSGSRSVHSLRRPHQAPETVGDGSGNSTQLLEIPEEIYRVRRAALQVLKPLTRTWVRYYSFF